MRFELMTSSLPRRRSTPELRGHESYNCEKNWSGRRDSNSRPSAWKADALPTELHPPTTTIANFQLSNANLKANAGGKFESAISNRKSPIHVVQGAGFEPA